MKSLRTVCLYFNQHLWTFWLSSIGRRSSVNTIFFIFNSITLDPVHLRNNQLRLASGNCSTHLPHCRTVGPLVVCWLLILQTDSDLLTRSHQFTCFVRPLLQISKQIPWESWFRDILSNFLLFLLLKSRRFFYRHYPIRHTQATSNTHFQVRHREQLVHVH